MDTDRTRRSSLLSDRRTADSAASSEAAWSDAASSETASAATEVDSFDPAPLDRSSPLPLWAQLLDRLRNGVERGDFDRRFPTELELTEAFDVSRHTVREAIRRLEMNGVVTRQRGRGTFLTQAEFRQPLGTLYSLFRSVEAQGIEQRSEVLAKEIRQDPTAAARLGLPPDTPLVFLERVRYAGSEPLALDRAWLPASIAAPVLEADFARAALYDELEARCGIRPDEGHEEIRPVSLAPGECTRLPLEAGHAMFSIDRLTKAGDTLIEWRQSLVRGDRFSFVADWSAAGDSTAPDVIVHDIVTGHDIPTGG